MSCAISTQSTHHMVKFELSYANIPWRWRKDMIKLSTVPNFQNRISVTFNFSNTCYRSQNTYRRRRKRPRPQPPQDGIQFPSPAHVERPEEVVLPHEEQTSHYHPLEAPQKEYSVYEKSVSSTQNFREPETLPFESQHHHSRPQRRRPNSSRHKQQSQDQPGIPVRVPSPDIQVKTEEDIYENKNAKPVEHSVNTSQDEGDIDANDSSNDDSESFVEKFNYTHKRNRNEQHKRPHGSIRDRDVTKPQQNSYHESHPSQFQGDNNDAVVSPQDIKALLKQQSGSLSLSELLQQKNLSLADLLKGDRNALSALTGVSNAASSEGKTEGTNQEPVPPRQLPSRTNPRRKNQGTGHHQKPLRYSAKQEHISEDYDLESTKHRRLPPVHRPSWSTQPSHDTDRPVKYEVQAIEQTESDIQERINKFVPSSPRRLPPPEVTLATDTTLTSSTESNELTKSSNPEDQSPDSQFNVHGEKHSEIEIQNKEKDNLHSISSVTEHNIIINPSALEPSHKNSPEDDTEPKQLTTDHKSAPIPLDVQETSVIDPLQNSPEADTMDQKAVGNNRMRGKYIPRHRISIAPKNSSNKVDTTKSGRVRLPPPNLFLSPLRQRVNNQMISTKDMHDGTTMEPVRVINTVPQTHITPKTVTLTEGTAESAIRELQSVSPEVQHNESLPSGQITDLTEKNSVTVEENNDQSLLKISPFQLEPLNSQSQRTQENSRAKITSARDEILEFLKTDSGSVRLARILASRNMTLAELIEHRERGSSQQHIADIFRESRQPVYQPTEANMSEAYETEPNHGIINNEVKNNVRNLPQMNANGIPSIQEMFSFLEESDSNPSDHEMNQQTPSTSTQEQVNSKNHSTEGSEYPEQTLQSEPQVPDTLPSFQPNPPLHIPHVPTLKPSDPSSYSWKISYQQPDTIYSFDPTNPYFSSGRRPIITSRLTTPASATPLTNNDITHSVLLLENMGQVREVASTGVTGIKGPIEVHNDEDKQFDVLYREDTDDLESDSALATDVKSTFIVSSAILGLAILGFLAIFVVCRWRQKQARRRFVDGIVNARAHSPILMQPEEINIRQSLSPVMVNTRDLYKMDVSLDGDDDNEDTRSRRYYLWRTIRKTLRYK